MVSRLKKYCQFENEKKIDDLGIEWNFESGSGVTGQFSEIPGFFREYPDPDPTILPKSGSATVR